MKWLLILFLWSPILLRQRYTRQDFKPMCYVFFLCSTTPKDTLMVWKGRRGASSKQRWCAELSFWTFEARLDGCLAPHATGTADSRKTEKNIKPWIDFCWAKVKDLFNINTIQIIKKNKWSSIRNHMAVHIKGSEHISGECVWLKKRHVKGKQKDVAFVSRT